MSNHELKVARIGNSRGVRLPADTLKRYRIGESVIMEERSEGILLRPNGSPDPKLSWEETAAAMAAAAEDWSDWDAIAGDGLESVPWDEGRPGKVAEPRAGYGGGKKLRAKPRRSK